MARKLNPLEDGVELIKDRYYFFVKKNYSVVKLNNISYLNTENDFVYQRILHDFGPLPIDKVTEYCRMVMNVLKNYKGTNTVLCHETNSIPQKLTTAAYLVGCFSVLVLGLTPVEVMRRMLEKLSPDELLNFKDQKDEPNSWQLSLLDTLKGLAKATYLGFYNVITFNIEEYQSLLTEAEGRMVWMVPAQIVTLPAPTKTDDKEADDKTFQFYLKLYIKNRIRAVVTLNSNYFRSAKFHKRGVKHVDISLESPLPSMETVEGFNRKVTRLQFPIAMHCADGTNESSLMTACYLIYEYQFSAAEAIAWTRIMRPGSIIDFQQEFLVRNEANIAKKKDKSELETKMMQLSEMVKSQFETSGKPDTELTTRKAHGLYSKQDSNKKHFVDLVEKDKEVERELMAKIHSTKEAQEEGLLGLTRVVSSHYIPSRDVDMTFLDQARSPARPRDASNAPPQDFRKTPGAPRFSRKVAAEPEEPKSAPRGSSRGVVRGVSRGAQRGASIGPQRESPSRGVSRGGPSRGVSRGGPSRGVSRGGPSRGVSRGSPSRGLSGSQRGSSRGAPRGSSRGGARGRSRGVDGMRRQAYNISDFI